MKPLVSIVMPAHNTATYIGEAISSVRAQEFEDWELVVVDDCSPMRDDLAALTAAEGDPRVHVHRLEANGGVARARNIAIDKARGRYIAFLDSDDLWLPHKLSHQLAFMRETGAAFSYSAYEEIDEAGAILRRLPVPREAGRALILRCCVIGCLTAIYDTQATGKVFMPELRKRQDWATWLELIRIGGPALGLDDVLARYRLRSGSLSRNKAGLAKYAWALYREQQGLSAPHAAAMLALYGLNGVLRRHVPGFARTVKYI